MPQKKTIIIVSGNGHPAPDRKDEAMKAITGVVEEMGHELVFIAPMDDGRKLDIYQFSDGTGFYQYAGHQVEGIHLADRNFGFDPMFTDWIEEIAIEHQPQYKHVHDTYTDTQYLVAEIEYSPEFERLNGNGDNPYDFDDRMATDHYETRHELEELLDATD